MKVKLNRNKEKLEVKLMVIFPSLANPTGTHIGPSSGQVTLEILEIMCVDSPFLWRMMATDLLPSRLGKFCTVKLNFCECPKMHLTLTLLFIYFVEDFHSIPILNAACQQKFLPIFSEHFYHIC